MGCWPRVEKEFKPDELNKPDLSGSKLNIPLTNHQGATFKQFVWATEVTADFPGSRVILDVNSRPVAVASGSLMEGPGSEVRLCSGGATWAVLRNPRTSTKNHQLWMFKVCRGDGTPYADVRQKSETQCIVTEPSSRRRIMALIGNFTYPMFLSGEKNINVWVTQANEQFEGIGAQCETRLEEVVERPDGEDAPSLQEVRRFHVSCTANYTDASLVLAVLLGMQEVHAAAWRVPGAGSLRDAAETQEARASTEEKIGEKPEEKLEEKEPPSPIPATAA